MVSFTSSRLKACYAAPLLLLLSGFASPAASAPIAPRPPRLSPISLFEPGQRPTPDFLTSVQAQADALDLHILQLVQRREDCEEMEDRLPYNIQRTCVTRPTLAEWIADLLCDEWRCEKEEEKRVQAQVAAIADSTRSFEMFKPLFGLLLRDFLPQANHWGWLQANTLVGDLESLFPFDLLERFDIITYLTSPQEAIHLSNTITVLRHLPFANLVSGAEEFASSSAFLAVESSSALPSGFWTERLLHSPKSSLNWIAVTHGLAQTSEEDRIISLHGRRLQSLAPQYAIVDVLRKPRSRSTFTKSAGIGPLHLQQAEAGEDAACASSDGVQSRLCPLPSSYSTAYRVYYMRVLGQLLERKEPLAAEEQFSKPEEVLFAPSVADVPKLVQATIQPMLVLQM